MVAYMFQGGPAPQILASIDTDGSGEIDISDLIYQVNYMFVSGFDPICGIIIF